MPHPLLHSPLLILFAASTLLTLGMAAVVLRWHDVTQRRDESARRQGAALALEFAHFLCGRSEAASLRAQAQSVRAEVFWTALETFSDGIEGEQWRKLTAALKDLGEVERLHPRLRRGSPWTRAIAARRLGLVEDPAQRRPLFKAMEAGPTIVTLTAGLALARLRDESALDWLLQHP